MRLALLAVTSLALGGCTLDFGGGGDDQCLPVPASATGHQDLAPLPSLVNPETLECESFSPGNCNPACGDCPPGPEIPTWAFCGTCSGVDEATCLAATGCRAVYDYNCYTGMGPCTAEVPYLGCFGTDQTGPIHGACNGLDAFECSQHDDCIALHSVDACPADTSCLEGFVECVNETTCWGPVLCDVAPPSCPPGSTPEISNGCYTGQCKPLDECEPPPPPPPPG
jgi:hypothetical protein